MAGITLHNAVGAECNDITTGINQTNGTVSVSSSVKNTGGYSYSLSGNSNFRLAVEFGTPQASSSSSLFGVSFWFRASSVNPSNTSIICDWYDTSANNAIYLALTTSGYLQVLNAASSTVATGTTQLSADTWYYISLIADVSSATGAYSLWLEDAEELSGTSDFRSGGADPDYFTFSQTNSIGITAYFDDICVFSGIPDREAFNNVAYKMRVHRYRSTKASATPDTSGLGTTALDEGQWVDQHEIALNDGTSGNYTGGISAGGVFTDDAGGSSTGGPNTDTEVGDEIYGVIALFRAKRSGGGGTAQYGHVHGSQTNGNVTGGVSADSGKTLDISGQLSWVDDMSMSPNGTRLYIQDGISGSGIIYQYNLTTPFDISTASYSSKSLDPSSYVGGYANFDIASNGEHIYIGDTSTDDLFQFDLSTPWELDSASHQYTLSSTAHNAVAISADGTKVATNSDTGNTGLELTLATPWDLSSQDGGGVNSENFNSSGERGLRFSDDGKFLLRHETAVIVAYRLRTPWSSRSIIGTPMGINNFDPYTDATQVGGQCFGDNGTRLYVAPNQPSGSGNGLVKSYTLSDRYSAWNTTASFNAARSNITGDLDIGTSYTDYGPYFTQTNIPRTTEWGFIGISKDSGGQDYDVSWVVYHVLSILDPPVTSIPRNVTCSTEVITFTENTATVTIPDFSRTVTCSTETISITESAAIVSFNIPKTVIGSSAPLKKWKGLSSQTLTFLGTNSQSGYTNALDGNTGTYDQTGQGFVYARGLAPYVGGVDSTTEKPIRVEVRMYASNGGTVTVYGGYDDDTNLNFNPTFVSNQALTSLGTFSASGAWSDWLVVTPGNYNWADPHNSNFEPLSWDQIQDNLCIGNKSSSTNTRIHAIEIRIWSGEAVLRTGYFDGHVQINNSGDQWTSITNAYDGSTSTWASHDASNTNWLSIKGNTLTQGDASDEIYGIYYRAYVRFVWNGIEEVDFNLTISNQNSAQGMTNVPLIYEPNIFFPCIFNDNALAGYSQGIFDISSSNSGFWTPWYSTDLTSPAYIPLIEPWKNNANWTDLPNFWVNLRRQQSGDASASVQVARAEIAVLAAPSNTNRKGGRAKKDRTLNCSTEVILLTTNSATVSKSRGIAGNTEVISVTANAATISFTSPRNVTGITEVVTLTESAATINATRNVSCTTEVITLTTNPATVHAFADLNVDATTEVITLTQNAATVKTNRGVLCSTETITLTEATATVNVTRSVSCATEIIALTSSPATVDFFTPRVVTGTTEIISVATSAATINRTRGVIAQTEVVTVVANAATIDTNIPRNVEGATEVVLLATTPAITNTERIVGGVTEVITLSENAASVTTSRLVNCSTEVISLISNAATVNAARIVSSLTEQIALTESAATVSRNRSVSCSTEVIILTTNSAIVTAPVNRDVVCSTEVITLTATPAGVNARRVVGSTVEFIQVVNPASTVNTERNVVSSVEQIALVPSNSLIDTTRDVVCSTEVITLSDNDATVNRNRIVTCLTEVITLTENLASILTDRGVLGSTEVITFTENSAQVFRGVNRVVTCTTEVITLTENNAGVNKSRDVTCSTEVITLTANAATVFTGANRDITCSTEVITLTANAATVFASQNREVTCSTEVITIGANNAQIQRSRSISANTEAISLAATNSSVGLQRNVAGGTQGILFTESGAGVNLSRNVQSQTEVISLVANLATLLAPREVNAITEQVSISTTQASINRSLSIQCLTEVIQVINTNAQVFTGANRFINCVTEQIILTSNQASIFKSLSLAASTEVIQLSANSATVSRVTTVAGTTEVISLVTSTASLNRTRTIQCATEVINLTTSIATVNRTSNRDVICTTEVISLSTNNAIIAFPRIVVGFTEVIEFVANPATMYADRIIVTTTETITLTTSQASVRKTLSGVIPGYSMTYLRPEPEFLILWRDQ